MAHHSIKSALFRWLPVVAIAALLVTSLTMLHLLTQNAEKYYEAYFRPLIFLNGFILSLLSIAILYNLLRIIYQWHTHQAGSRFTLRLMAGFLILTLLPAIIVSIFSINFIGKNINKQLDDNVKEALSDALQLSKNSLLVQTKIHLDRLAFLGQQLSDKTPLEISRMIDQWRVQTGAYETGLLTEELEYLVNSVDRVDQIIPIYYSGGDLLRKMADRDRYSHLEPFTHNEKNLTFSRVAVRVNLATGESGILTALFQIPVSLERSSQNVLHVYNEYKSISFRRDEIKDTFRLALMVIVILTVLFSLWAAFIFSRRLTKPVRDLVEGTLAVASGNLEKKLPVSERDDFSLLARSFNTMTKRLAHVQDEREQARTQLQQEHDYLDVVLEHLSSGVVTLDKNHMIRRTNTAADHILGHAISRHAEQDLTTTLQQYANLQPFLNALQPWLHSPEQDWQAEIELTTDGQRKVLICRGAGLPSYDAEQQQGYVLVFEDITDVVQAEHDAAWSEVARRLAHEIKNPLTPIQLSAERLSRKLSKTLDTDSQTFLNRMTGTIVQQVDTLKSMVNAFSEYAKAPALVLQPADLNQLIREVVELYQGNKNNISLHTDLHELPVMLLDPHRLRQLLVNLIKNAQEAMTQDPAFNATGDMASITISSRLTKDTKQPQAVITVQDSGPGIPENLLPQLFEPYVTNKHKGTGLGLAIVKKIVEEHEGSISARNAMPTGAMLSIQLPVREAGVKRQTQECRG